jgi:flagellar capping protein FliD
MSDQEPKNNNLINFIATTVETMRDQMATKSDLAQLEDRLSTKIEVEITAVRGDIEQIHLRLDSIERALRARLDQLETEMSRMRSVLYLLVKDRPDMLRLLGQTPPLSNEGHP